MIQVLRPNLLYSEKRARDILFLAVAEIVAESRAGGSTVILSKLTREAAAYGRQWGERAGMATVNWEMAAKAVLNTMLSSGVLLDSNGEVVVPGVGAQAAGIGGVRTGYEQISEAYLVEFLIRKLGDVSTRDHKTLAHALFRQFDPGVPIDDLEDRVVLLLATLSSSVTLSEHGTYSA